MKYFRITPLLIGIIILFSSACRNGKIKQVQNEAIQISKVDIYTTARDTALRLSHTGTCIMEDPEQATEGDLSIFVNPAITFQELIGIGGSITDASAEVFAALPENLQDELIKAYFSDEGIGYSLLRTHIHSCDFSSGSYTYIEEGDVALETFSIDHDLEYRIPMIERALEQSAGRLKVYVSPWSPPAFMKSNNNMLQGGSLLPEYYDSWARYFAKFIKAYEARGIPVWGLTIQNEPMATQRWESCIYTSAQERDFLKGHLGPILESNGLGDKKIIVWDHNRDLIVERANTILSDPEAAKYVWGVGFHWYETWTGSEPNYKNLGVVKESFPDKELIFTEGCNEVFDPEKYGYWPNAERYGDAMINDFNHGASGWTDWNILLNEFGGPNHVGNYCFAPVHGKLEAGELIYTPSYYYIGHFSKFIRPGAKRVSTSCSRSYLQSTSFRNPDGSFATVVLNLTNNELGYNFYVNKRKVVLRIPARAMQTIVY